MSQGRHNSFNEKDKEHDLGRPWGQYLRILSAYLRKIRHYRFSIWVNMG